MHNNNMYQYASQMENKNKVQGSWDWKPDRTMVVAIIRFEEEKMVLLLIYPLASHENFSLAVQRKRSVIFPEAVKQLHVFELLVLITNCNRQK